MKKAILKQNIHIQPDEDVIIVVRKHWFVLLRDSIGVIIAGLLPFFFISVLTSSSAVNPALSTFFTAVWLLALWMMLFTIWTNYYLDVWVVTDRRIINIDQIHLFKRNIIILRIERVQNITVKVHGFFATFLKFGNLEIQTAGPEASTMVIQGIPNPSYVRNSILEYVDIATEHKSKLEYNREESPNYSQ